MLNKVILMGRLTHEPESKALPSGMSVCNFSLAVQRDFARQGEERQTDFINIVAFGPRADFVARYFRKGQLVAVCGRLQTRSWEDQNGNKRYATDVVADEVHFAEPKREGGSGAYNEYGQGGGYESYAPQQGGFGGYAQTNQAPAMPDTAMPQGFSANVDDDDLPF